MIIPTTNASILEDLSLNDCRITQNQESHLKKGNWSMYAVDIACIRWKSFTVYTPNYFDIYVIDYIWIDKRLWNFLILKHWDYKFVYWHTKTELNIWDRLWKKQILWKIDKSWISQNYHLHIELWYKEQNINWHKLNWKELEINPKSFDLKSQRWLVEWKEINQKILDFISWFEWYRECAYNDWKQFSIWYWTKAKSKNECITKEEADKRARIVIENIKNKYWLNHLDLNKQKAIISFVYNIWSLSNKQIWLLNNWYFRALGNDFLLYNKAWWQILWWLVKRRQAEFNLLN